MDPVGRLDALVARLSSPQAAVAVAVGLQRQDDAEALLTRAHALAIVDPASARALAARAAASPGPHVAEAQALAALFGGHDPVGDGPLAAAARVRRAPDAELAGVLHHARQVCVGVLAEAWLRIALRGRGLEQRGRGALTAVLDPARSRVDLPGATLDLGRAHRRFAVLWALATAQAAVAREDLFERVWSRPWLGDEDASALQATVSRTRAMLPDGMGIVGLPGGAYGLEQDWALFTPRDAPVTGAPLAPLGRDAEAAALRLALRAHGCVVLRGQPGSGTSHLARAIARGWPAQSVFADLRAGTLEQVVPDPRVVGGRLLVVDHADALDVLPWQLETVLLVRTTPLSGAPEVSLGPLAPRDAASLAKALGVADPSGPAFPLALRLGNRPLHGLRPSARRLLARLLAVPGGAPTGLARRLGGQDVLATLDDLALLQERRLLRRHGGRLVAEDAIRADIAAEELPDVVHDWQARQRASVPAHLVSGLEEALAIDDLDRANVALRRLVPRCGDHRALRAQALLALAEVAGRSGRPDSAVEHELSTLAAAEPGPVAARLLLHGGVRSMWRSELPRARQELRRAARRARHTGAWDTAEVAWAQVAEACLRLGLVEACERALASSAEVGERCTVQRTTIRAAVALDMGKLGPAAALLARAPDVAPVWLRRGQLEEGMGRDPRACYRSAIEGFADHDRRWLPITLALLARSQPTDAAALLEQARAALSPDDVGSTAAVTLVEASLAGNLPTALKTLRVSGHPDATTFPWDLVRFIASRDRL